ncbi:MAG TPA: M14 family zinc carboxypeptidase [Bacteroidales bacterium]|nr:M14 family zinc carboxypeptidase [Bacteroidales bacterium]
MKRFFSLFFTFFILFPAYSQVTINYFLPNDVSYNPSIPTPKEIIGHEVGEWHLTHDKLLYYMLKLADVSDRAIWEEYARSYEGRPLGQLIISSPDNIKNIEQIRLKHLQLCDPSVSGNLDIKNMPLFVKLGYGVHGNESSAQNASVLVAYYLTAATGEKIDELLKNTVILIDPSLNPDGMQRHSSWVNSTKSLNNNPDANSWEFNETWPGGRTNHYWFDLNRDYILLQHPESIGRVAAFYRWRPNINTDHHEMGADATFFFQPGVQSRNNPLTPADNQGLTAEIGKYHEKYLDAIGSLYYTEESYDDFYVGKGSSYPDIHGSVGILFEQAGVKGHLRETPAGVLSFPFAIRNQFEVSMSSLEAGMNMREKLLDSQRSFYKDAVQQADKYPVKAFIFSEHEDNYRVNQFISNLLQHQIKIYKAGKDITSNGIIYKNENSYVVPLRQNEYRFIRCLFEPVKDFTDSVFYDISTWVLPMSFNISFSAITAQKEVDGLIGAEITTAPACEGKLIVGENPYAYIFEWNEYLAPKALYMLQSAGVSTRVSTDRFTVKEGSLNKDFGFGTIMIPVAAQEMSQTELRNLIEKTSNECGITFYGVGTGLTPSGIDLGSSKFSILKRPSVIMFAGEGANSSDAGEIWHMLDTRFRIPVTMVTSQRFNNINLDSYNVLIIDGSPNLNSAVIDKIREWNHNGGTIIGYKSGNNWLSKNKLANIEFIPEAVSSLKIGVYANRDGDRQVNQIPGSIFEARLDLTHPLCYGYTRDRIPVFKSDESVASKDADIYSNPAVYTAEPLLSGYCSKANIERIKGAAFVSVHGRRIISIYDNTNFRAITYGTNKIFINSIFFGQML